MAQARKYAFDTEFAPDGGVMRDAPKRITPEDVEAARAQAYESGKNDALAQAERRTAAALEAIAGAAGAIVSRLDAETHAMRAEAARTALAAARQIAGAALDAFGVERAAHAVEAAMDALRHQPRLVVKLALESAEELKGRIGEICERHGYASAVLVRGEPSLTTGEIAIDWSDGVITLSAADAAQRIEALIEAALAGEAHSEHGHEH